MPNPANGKRRRNIVRLNMPQPSRRALLDVLDRRLLGQFLRECEVRTLFDMPVLAPPELECLVVAHLDLPDPIPFCVVMVHDCHLPSRELIYH